MDTSIKVITYSEFRHYMVEHHWTHLGHDRAQTRFGIPLRFCSSRYSGQEALDRILMFPLGAFKEGRLIGATLTYNISDTAISLWGLFVSQEHRGRGAASQLLNSSFSLWPAPWTKCVGLFREDSIQIFQQKGWKTAFEWEARSCPYRGQTLPYKVILMEKMLPHLVSPLIQEYPRQPVLPSLKI